jgi:hypothetical protein
VSVDSEFFQSLGKGIDIVLAQHVDLHLGSKTLYQRKLGLGLGKIGNPRREREEVVDVVLE